MLDNTSIIAMSRDKRRHRRSINFSLDQMKFRPRYEQFSFNDRVHLRTR